MGMSADFRPIEAGSRMLRRMALAENSFSFPGQESCFASCKGTRINSNLEHFEKRKFFKSASQDRYQITISGFCRVF